MDPNGSNDPNGSKWLPVPGCNFQSQDATSIPFLFSDNNRYPGWVSGWVGGSCSGMPNPHRVSDSDNQNDEFWGFCVWPEGPGGPSGGSRGAVGRYGDPPAPLGVYPLDWPKSVNLNLKTGDPY